MLTLRKTILAILILSLGLSGIINALEYRPWHWNLKVGLAALATVAATYFCWKWWKTPAQNKAAKANESDILSKNQSSNKKQIAPRRISTAFAQPKPPYQPPLESISENEEPASLKRKKELEREKFDGEIDTSKIDEYRRSLPTDDLQYTQSQSGSSNSTNPAMIFLFAARENNRE